MPGTLLASSATTERSAAGSGPLHPQQMERPFGAAPDCKAQSGHGDMWRDGMTTSTNETDSIANTGDDAAFTNAQLAQMFNAGMNGDTKAADLTVEPTKEDDAKPAASSDAANTEVKPEGDPAGSGKQPEPTPAAKPEAKPDAVQDPDPATAVILAKDGKHQIPFEKLQQARDGERHWREQAQQAQVKLAELTAQAQARADAGQQPTPQDQLAQAAQAAIDNGFDPAMFGDFSDAAIAKGIFELNRQTSEKLRADVKAEVMQEVLAQIAPVIQQHQKDGASSHVVAILKAHPEAPSILESSEFAAWQGKQPTYVQDAMKTVLEKGSSQQVIELLGSYKAAVQPAQPTQQSPEKAQPQATQAAAQKVVEQLKTPVPNSPSDIPGGASGGGTLAERLSAMSEVELFNAMNSGQISEEQLNRFLSRKS